MRAKEFINEVATTSRTNTPVIGQSTTSTTITPTSAPSLGSPTAVQQADQTALKKLASTGITLANQQQSKKPTGFLGGIAHGFKQGMGMDTDKSIASNLASAGLKTLGLQNTAAAISQSGKVSDSQLPRPGQSVKDPITGKGMVRVMANPEGNGIKLDTTKSLGHPIIINPKDLI
jgi:hypothetical protein